MIAGRLTMRAAIERDQAAGKDAWGNPVAPAFAAVGEPAACFVWSNSAKDIRDGKKVAGVEELRGMFALGTDILPDDEITSVCDRRGAVLIAGRLKVQGPVQFKHTHLEAALRRIG